jgi:hypothetical protein
LRLRAGVTEDWRDPVTSRARQLQAVMLVAHGVSGILRHRGAELPGAAPGRPPPWSQLAD